MSKFNPSSSKCILDQKLICGKYTQNSREIAFALAGRSNPTKQGVVVSLQWVEIALMRLPYSKLAMAFDHVKSGL
jgi:hypothetical protein